MEDKMRLIQLRKKINLVDQRLVRLLEKRLLITHSIGHIKEKLNLNLTDQAREKQIIDNLKEITNNLILKDHIELIFNEIFRLSKSDRILNSNNKLPFVKIGIIGFGLIGGSIAKTLKVKNNQTKIFTIKRKSHNNILAKKEGIIDHECTDFAELTKTVKIIILATEIKSIIPLAQIIAKQESKVNHRLIVIDVASVKTKISNTFERLSSNKIEFLATHPIAGSEKSNFENCRSWLFINKPWVITPHKKNHTQTINRICQLIKSLGSRPIIMSADNHDKSVAIVSHLIFLLSSLILAFVYKLSKKSLRLVGNGFISMTRLAGGNPILHEQIIKENNDNIQQSMKLFIDFIQKNKVNTKNCHHFLQKIKKYAQTK